MRGILTLLLVLVLGSWSIAGYANPRDTVAQVCSAAATTLNRNVADGSYHSLTPVNLSSVPAKIQSKVTAGVEDVVKVIGMARIMIHGRAVKVYVIEGQGSASSTYFRIWSDDLSTLIADTNKSLVFGEGQKLVQVLGHPLVMQFFYSDPTSFSLATIGKNGKAHIICNARRGYAPSPRITTGAADRVCRAIVRDSVTPIHLQAIKKQAIILPTDVKSYYSHFSIIGAAHADLFNNGQKVNVGLIAYKAYESSSYGGHYVHAVFPAVIDASGTADLTGITNTQIFKASTGSPWFSAFIIDNDLDSPRGGRLVTYGGKTYFVTYNEPIKGADASLHTLTSALRFTAKGGKLVCKFQPNRFTVLPVAGVANQLLP